MIKLCPICKKEFKNSHKKIVCCSRECASILCKQTGRLAGKNNPAFGKIYKVGIRIKRICKFCNKKFEVLECIVKRGAGNFCSRSCLWDYINGQDRTGKNNPNYRHGLKSKGRKARCIDCGKRISNSYNEKCSSCVKGGTGIPYELTEYGTEFDNALKEMVRFRDKYKCKVCGCSQLENGRQLDCHHKDYDKKNNKLNNLVALCQSCHSKTNYNRDYWYSYFNFVLEKVK